MIERHADEPSPETLAEAVRNPVGTVLAVTRRAAGAARAGFVLFYNSDNLTFASSIAYYTLLSVFPFLLLVLAAIGRFAAPDGRVGPNLLNLVAVAVPSRFDFLVGQLEQLSRAPLQLGIAGTLLTLWASMGVFGAITSAVNHAWGVEQNYSFWKHKLVAFIMMMAAGGLAVVALALIGVVQVVEARWFAGVLAAAHAWAGQPDEGLALAEQAIDTPRPDTTGWSLPAEPMFAPLRSAAGYARLAAHLASRAS